MNIETLEQTSRKQNLEYVLDQALDQEKLKRVDQKVLVCTLSEQDDLC